MRIQFLKPALTARDIAEVSRVLKGGWLTLSEETRKFEEAFARYHGVKHAVLLNSCTCALQLALEIAGIDKGDEVITTPFTYVSSVSPILHCGAAPVFVDVEEGTGLLDLTQVERAITPRTKAILPVHLYGQMVDMKALGVIARKNKLLIIEDAAHAIESERDGIKPGQKSFAACFSFHTAKNITAGQGGALITDDDATADRTRLLRRDGVANVGPHRRMLALGHKFLLTDFQAALLSSQLKRIDAQWEKRKVLHERYAAALTSLGVPFSRVVHGSRHAYHMIVAWVDPRRRDDIRSKLASTGIETSIHYDPVHLEPFFRKTFGYKEGDFPVTERLGASTITLPMHPTMTRKEQDYVIAALRSVLS